MVNPPVTIIAVAAGSGSRFGSALPKQFCLLEGRPVIMRTLESLHNSVPSARLVLSLSPTGKEIWHSLCAEYGFSLPVTIVQGGETRWHTVSNAIKAGAPYAAGEIILIHDGARPLVDTETVLRVIDGAKTGGAAVPVVAVTDSLRRIPGNGQSFSVPRKEFVAVQTPQGFDAQKLQQAYCHPYKPQFTDDASVMENAGYNISIVEGNPDNIKITHSADIDIAAVLLHHRKNN